MEHFNKFPFHCEKNFLHNFKKISKNIPNIGTLNKPQKKPGHQKVVTWNKSDDHNLVTLVFRGGQELNDF